MHATIGIAGCGAMGLPMASRLQRAGFQVHGFDIRPRDEFGEFKARMIDDPGEFARRVDVLVTVVRDIAQTEALLFEDQKLMKESGAPRKLIVSSTLSPRYVRTLPGRLPAGTDIVDAPMSGAPYRARSGELSFMLGGDASLVAELSPLFRAMGNDVYHLGPLGHGMTVKVLNNYCAAASVVATRRVLGFAAALGVDRQKLLDVMRTSSGSNWFADNIDAIDWSLEGYAADNTIGIVYKDVTSTLDAIADCDMYQHDLADGDQLDLAILTALRELKSSGVE